MIVAMERYPDGYSARVSAQCMPDKRSLCSIPKADRQPISDLDRFRWKALSTRPCVSLKGYAVRWKRHTLLAWLLIVSRRDCLDTDGMRCASPDLHLHVCKLYAGKERHSEIRLICPSS